MGNAFLLYGGRRVLMWWIPYSKVIRERIKEHPECWPGWWHWNARRYEPAINEIVQSFGLGCILLERLCCKREWSIGGKVISVRDFIYHKFDCVVTGERRC